MKRTSSAAARVRQAQAELIAAQNALEKNALPWQRWWRRHRGSIALGGGLASGLALTLLPPRWWARVGALVGEATAIAARSALVPVLVGALLPQAWHGDAAHPPAAREPASPAKK